MNIKEAIDNYTAAPPKMKYYETTAFGRTFKDEYLSCPKCGVMLDYFFKPNYCERCGKHIDWSGFEHGADTN